ncbi:MAG: cadmium-translocating P-type ATPase [Gemmatimonadetes bacterium]|nr:cadmium-translocating P-type ATPase [Gemmatimonadota bacterium]
MEPSRSPWVTPFARRTYLSGALGLTGVVVSWLTGVPDRAGWLAVRTDLAGLLYATASLVGGSNFFMAGVRAARTLKLDMNFLMSAAIVGALLIGEPFEAAAIAALFSLAELLERAAVVRARRSIEELVRLAPVRARVVTPEGTEREIAASELAKGHRVRVRPGEQIPIDGRVLDGASAVDEATVTGESVPVTKRAGDPVYAGTLLAEGYLEIEATTDAGDTTLDRIVKLVRQAQAQRSPSERLVERFARYYTPAVTGLAVLTMALPPLLGWGTGLEWLTRGLTLLVIACPCALVIATPVTVVSAITSAARHGVLIKGGEYLEALGRTCAMAFDKTGSLTQGRLKVSEVEGIDGTPPDDVLRLAVAVEQRSEHPIARAIVSHAAERGVPTSRGEVTGFEARTGRGVVATVNGREIRVGTPDLFADSRLPERFGGLEREGKTVVLVSHTGRLVGLIALADQPRPAAARVLRRLERLGVHEQVMLTGDHELVAKRIAEELGIATVRARLLPEDKVRAVEELRREHATVAMLGDGVNDAPALAAASVGIAMGAAGSPATIETADVALMADDLAMLPYAVRLAKLARRIIRFNILLALGLKLVLAGGAIGGAVSLLVAVLVGDMGASLVVTLNAMRLAQLGPEDVR